MTVATGAELFVAARGLLLEASTDPSGMIAGLNATGGWYLSTNGGGMLGGPPVNTSAVRQLLELALTEPHGDRALCVT
jgi:hypothetical protein